MIFQHNKSGKGKMKNGFLGRLKSSLIGMLFLKGLFLNSRKSAGKFFYNAVEIGGDEEGLIKIVPVGYFPEHPNGAHTISYENIQQMADNIKNSGTDILFDFGHDSIWNSGAVAAGWSDKTAVEARQDGLYIKYPAFTPAAKEKVNGREYRYFSPAYVLNDTNKLGTYIGATLHSVGLVNKPYMDTEIDHIKNSFQNNQEEGVQEMNPQLLKFLGLSEGATEAEIEAKLNSLRSKYQLNGDATIEDIITAMEKKLNAASQEGTTLEVRVKALETKMNSGELDKAEALVNSAIEDGKILPADKDVFLNSAKGDFEATKRILDAKKKNSAVPSTVETPKEETKKNSVQEAASYIKTLRSQAVK
jgi:phage I-like protein